MVGSRVPSCAFETAPLPIANVVQTRLFALSSLSRLYSSCHAPLLTEPVTNVDCVTLLPSVGALISTVGGATLSLTLIVMSSLLLKAPSPAVNRSTYVPVAPNRAEVTVTCALANVTEPGPLNVVQVEVRLLPMGSPSSPALPLSCACCDNRIVWSAPAFAVGD